MINLVEIKSKDGTEIKIKEYDQIIGQFMNCLFKKWKWFGTIVIMRERRCLRNLIATLILINSNIGLTN